MSNHSHEVKFRDKPTHYGLTTKLKNIVTLTFNCKTLSIEFTKCHITAPFCFCSSVTFIARVNCSTYTMTALYIFVLFKKWGFIGDVVMSCNLLYSFYFLCLLLCIKDSYKCPARFFFIFFLCLFFFFYNFLG